jgi:hypothetical protein
MIEYLVIENTKIYAYSVFILSGWVHFNLSHKNKYNELYGNSLKG